MTAFFTFLAGIMAKNITDLQAGGARHQGKNNYIWNNGSNALLQAESTQSKQAVSCQGNPGRSFVELNRDISGSLDRAP